MTKICAYCETRPRMNDTGQLCEYCWRNVPLILVERKLYVDRGTASAS